MQQLIIIQYDSPQGAVFTPFSAPCTSQNTRKGCGSQAAAANAKHKAAMTATAPIVRNAINQLSSPANKHAEQNERRLHFELGADFGVLEAAAAVEGVPVGCGF